MMQMTRMVLPALLLTLALGACGKKAQPVAPAPAAPTAAPAAAPAPTPAAPAAESAAERAARVRAVLHEIVYFDFDRSDVRADARPVLDSKVPHLREDGAIRLRIEGHADERGSAEYNLALGMRRANAVKQYFVGFGLDGARFEVVSFGEERPAVTGSNEAAWARNRRAEFNVLSGLIAGTR
jgi:peptidoglycan-associated lipoprotein